MPSIRNNKNKTIGDDFLSLNFYRDEVEEFMVKAGFSPEVEEDIFIGNQS